MSFLRGFSMIFLLGVVVTSFFDDNVYAHEYPHPIHLLMPHSGSAGHRIKGLNCLSWRLAVETNNLRDWMLSEECQGYVGHYMMGAQYHKDCLAVTSAAYGYLKSLSLKNGRNNTWIFDIDETSLSNLPYYARPEVGFGIYPYNASAFYEWQKEAIAPAIPAVLSFYNKLVRLGVKVVFLSGAQAELREPKERNMKNIGYHTWEKMILKKSSESHMKAVEYKSMHRTKLEKMGYTIIGNMGDQWSDLLGSHPGLRTFKLPDPMYYIG
ncbi:acid phosphatase 1-like [Chenopodium quinoa]|nr:acid phosphatase 1-like [Chenopodium quinoa]